MTWIDLSLIDGNGDAYEDDDNTDFNVSDIELLAESNTVEANRTVLGAHFQEILVPGGSQVHDVRLRGTPTSTGNDDANEVVGFNNVDSANDFNAEADVDQRAVTSETVDWVQTGLGIMEVESPSLLDAFEEVRARPGWASGNDVAVIVRGKSDASGNFRLLSYEGDSGLAPSFYAEYTEAGGLPQIYVDSGLVHTAADPDPGDNTQEFRDPAMTETPNCYLVFATQTLANGTARDNIVMSAGCCDGTNQFVSATRDEHNAATVDSERTGVSDGVILLQDNAAGIEAKAVHTDFLANDGNGAGVKLTWSTPPGNDWLVTVVMFKAVNALVTEIDPADVVDNTVTLTPGFPTSLMFAIHHSRTFDNGPFDQGKIGFGMCDGSLNQVSHGHEQQHGAGSETLRYRIRNDAVLTVAQPGAGNDIWLEVTEINSTEVIIATRNEAVSTLRAAALLLDLGTVEALVSAVDIPNSTGVQAYTTNFKPQMAGFLLGYAAAYNTIYSTDPGPATFGMGVCTESAEASQTITGDDDADPTDNQSLADTQAVVICDNSGAADVEGTLDSFDNDSVDINFTNAPGSILRSGLWAIEADPVPDRTRPILRPVQGLVPVHHLRI